MIKQILSRKIWALLLGCLSVLFLVLLAAGLGKLQFQPGHPLGQGESTSIQLSVEKIAAEIVDIPFWKQVVFWALLFILVIIIASLLSPELRKRIIRYFLRLAVFVLALFYIFKNFRNLFSGLELGNVIQAAGNGLSGEETTPRIFTPPQVPPVFLYLISLAVILVLVVIVFLVSRWWLQKKRLEKSAQPEDLVEIARSSLAEITTGRNWEETIIQCYIRMSDAASLRRGLERRKDLTASEYALRLEEAGLPREAVRRLTRLFEAARYGARSASRAERAEAVACLAAVLHACGVNE